MFNDFNASLRRISFHYKHDAFRFSSLGAQKSLLIFGNIAPLHGQRELGSVATVGAFEDRSNMAGYG